MVPIALIVPNPLDIAPPLEHPKLPPIAKSAPPSEALPNGYPKAPTHGAPNISTLLNKTSPLTAGKTTFLP